MNKQTIHFLKVGIAGVIGFTFLVGVLVFLSGYLNRGMTINVQFHDARGIKAGEVVRMAGVDIGQIGDVKLTPDEQAMINVHIIKGVKIPVGSKFIISNSIIGNQSIMTVMPSKSPEFIVDGASVIGDSADPIAMALAQSTKLIAIAEKTLSDSQKMVTAATKTIGAINDPRRLAKIDAMLENMRLTTERLPLLEMSVQREIGGVASQTHGLLASLSSTRTTADRAIGGAAKLTDNLNATLTENRGTLRSLLRSADDAASAVAGLTDQIKTTIGNKDIQANLVGTTQNLQSISSKLDATASDIQRFADDPKLNTDVRETVTNLRETSESVKDLAARLQGIHLPGEHRKSSGAPAPAKPFSATSLVEPGLVFDSVYDTKVERLRFDGDYTLVAGKPGSFYRAGLYDATYGNRLNLEAGHSLFDNRFDYRYGLIAGKLGVGFDLRTGPLDLRIDGFDPNHGTVNARAKSYINADTAITAGVDSIGHGNRATVGVQIRR
jgi:phospholipid/cholesterol/gamma-HCH transport system substrate-binding protein